MKRFILTVCLIFALLAPCFAFDIYNFIGKDVTITMRHPGSIDCRIITVMTIPRCEDQDQYGNCLREYFYNFLYVKKLDGECMFISAEDIANIIERHG